MPTIDLFFGGFDPGLVLWSPNMLQYLGHWLGLHLVRPPLDVADGAEAVVEACPAPAPSQFVVAKVVGPAAGGEV